MERRAGALQGEYTLELDGLGLQPGDMLHLRAVARDRNTVSGPGKSVSQTRIVRIARPDEVEQVNTLVGMPLEAEENPVLSQRMLILMTERLRDRAPRMRRDEVLEEAREIAHEQGRLRDRVGEQIFTRATGGLQPPDAHVGFQEESGAGHAHEEEGPRSPEEVLEEASRATGRGTVEEFSHRHDEAPVIGVDRRLLSIHDAMWAAERELGQGAPAAALPHQYEALRLVKEAQEGERRYARGTVRVDPVDVPGTRGTGELEGAAPAARSAGPAAPSLLPFLAELERVGARLRGGALRDASLELGALAGRVLAHPGADPRAAPLLSRAAEAAARGRREEARGLLLRARGLLSPPGGAAAAPPLPSTADPAAAEYFRRLGGSR